MDNIYKEYYDLLNTNDNSNNSKISIMAIIIDCVAAAKILNYINLHEDINDNLQARTFVIRCYACVVHEAYKHFCKVYKIDSSDKYEEFNQLMKEVASLRHKMHQFKYLDFVKKSQIIARNMGRSLDLLNPHLDLSLLYDDDGIIRGTNIFKFHLEELKNQKMVNVMQQFIRDIEGMVCIDDSITIKSSMRIRPTKWYVYCYTDVIKHAKIKDAKQLDRLLFAFDDLSMVNNFFRFEIEVSEYLRNYPYLIYYFCKIIAITLDETFDNLKSFIKNAKSENIHYFQEIIDGIDEKFIDICKVLRNNLHYDVQERIDIIYGDLYELLAKELDVVSKLESRILDILNINPTKEKLELYNLYAQIQK